MMRRSSSAILAAGLLALAACSRPDSAGSTNASDAGIENAGVAAESLPADEISPVDGGAGLANAADANFSDTSDANLSGNAAEPIGNSL